MTRNPGPKNKAPRNLRKDSSGIVSFAAAPLFILTACTALDFRYEHPTISLLVVKGSKESRLFFFACFTRAYGTAYLVSLSVCSAIQSTHLESCNQLWIENQRGAGARPLWMASCLSEPQESSGLAKMLQIMVLLIFATGEFPPPHRLLTLYTTQNMKHPDFMSWSGVYALTM